MEILSGKSKIDFMAKRKLALVFSSLLIVVAVASLAIRGLNFGIDFTGGTLIEVGYTQPADLTEIRSNLEAAGFGDAIVQTFGTPVDVLLRMPPKEGLSTAQLSDEVLAVLRSGDENMQMRRIEFVGPQVGAELAEAGGLAALTALLLIMGYVAVRFQYRFSIGSVAALVHDVVITLGFFSLFQFDFDLTVLAALLAVIGYSLNDTIVVFDRIRENFLKLERVKTAASINISINETLSRTVMTSITTMLVLVALLLLGGEVIRGFSMALIVGVLIGTYSSIFVASPVTLALGIHRDDLLPVEKEGDNFGSMP